MHRRPALRIRTVSTSTIGHLDDHKGAATAAARARLLPGHERPAGDGIDGDFGRLTLAALTKFQADQKLDLQYPGTIGPKTLAALGIAEPVAESLTPWIALAQRKMGLHEVRDNKALKDFLKSDGHALGDPAKLPWCGDFVETCIAVSLPREPMIDNRYWALNWPKFGVEVSKASPVMGAAER